MSMDIDVEQLASELILAVRGERTQVAMSRALGFSSNVVYLWESGRRAPETSRFLKMGELSGVPLDVTVFFRDASTGLRRARLSTPRGVQRLVQELTGGHVQSHLAERLDVDRTTLARWLDGKTEPRLPDFLRLVDITSQRLLSFVQIFADPAKLSSTRSVWQDLEAQRRLAYELPWSHAVLRALELCEYQNLPRHDDGFLACHLGLAEEEIQRSLAALRDAEQIQWTGTHFALSRVLTVDTRADPARDKRLKEHWSNVGSARLQAGTHPADALFSYNLFAVSHEHLAQIRQLHLEYYDAVRTLVNESPRADRVVLMNLQLLPLERVDEETVSTQDAEKP